MIIIPKRKWAFPLAYERSYNKTLRAYVARLTEAAEEETDRMQALMEKRGVKFDSYEDDLDALIAKIGANVDRKVAENALRRKVQQMYRAVNAFNEDEFRAVIHDAVGAEDFFINEKWQSLARSVWVQENLDYIRSIRRQFLDRIRQNMGEMILNAQEKQMRASELSGMIQDIAHNARNRADLIARDQIGKLNGRLTQYRQQSSGIGRYEWSTSRDERVRASHAEREGKIFSWDNPPPDGHPGMPIRCRCVALPVIDTETLGIARPVDVGGPAENGIITKEERLRENTTKLKGTMSEAEYDEYMELVNKTPEIRDIYSSYADKIVGVRRSDDSAVGGYYPYENRIDYSFETVAHVKNGMSKYSTLAHEYGHFFDMRASYKNLHFSEIDFLNARVVIGTGRTKLFSRMGASISDEFLRATRKDVSHILKNMKRADYDQLIPSDASSNVQEILCGILRAKTRWGHEEIYYNELYNRIVKLKLHNEMKKALNEIGFSVNNQAKVKTACRVYITAVENWANVMSAITVGGKELEYVRKWLPNSYEEIMRILKEDVQNG